MVEEVTESSWAEAIKAYAEEEIIESPVGYQFQIQNGTPMFRKRKSWTWEEHENADLCPGCGPYRIIKPEPKRLSFEEAEAAYLKGKTIRVNHQRGRRGYVDLQYHDEKLQGFDLHVVCYLDLAERRGWPIYEVEEGV